MTQRFSDRSKFKSVASNRSGSRDRQSQRRDRPQSGRFTRQQDWPNLSGNSSEGLPDNVALFPSSFPAEGGESRSRREGNMPKSHNSRAIAPQRVLRDRGGSGARGTRSPNLRNQRATTGGSRLEELMRIRAIATEKSSVSTSASTSARPINTAKRHSAKEVQENSNLSLSFGSAPELGQKDTQNAPSAPRPSLKNRAGKRRVERPFSPFLYATRMLILGVGMAVLSGTGLSMLNSGESSAQLAAEATSDRQVEESQKSSNSRKIMPLASQQIRELTPLKTQLTTLADEYPELMPGVFMIDLDTGGYVDINGSLSFAAASTIKVPVLVAFFQAVDEGKIRLDEILTMKKHHVAEGSGNMQYQPVGTKYTALETITKTIAISDNTATNMIIDRLGGAEVLNRQFINWGLRNTAIRNPLPDLDGTNTTSPRDLISLISQVEQGGLVSMKSRDRIFHIMEQTENDSLLPKGLGKGAIIAHKTGNINPVLADAGAIDMPNGKRYLLGVIVKRPDDAYSATKLIRRISGKVYTYLDSNPSN